MLSKHRSKKHALAGEWVDDHEVENCQLCESKFTFTKRRHHCRKCGKIVCAACSKNKEHLFSSRSGKKKRVCNACVGLDPARVKAGEVAHAGANDGSKSSTDDDSALDSSALSKSPEPVAARSASAESSSTAEVSSPRRAISTDSAAAGMSSLSITLEHPQVPLAEAVAALEHHKFEGLWQTKMTYEVVDIGAAKKDAVVGGVQVGSLAPGTVTSRGRGRGRGTRRSSAVMASRFMRPGSEMICDWDLAAMGKAYFKGTALDLGQFGKDGKLTGSTQQSTGRVTVQVSTKRFGTTYAFQFVGWLRATGEFVGTFTGNEISRMGGNVSGIFTAVRQAEGAARAAGGGDKDGSDAEA